MAVLEVRNLYFSYKETPVLDDVSYNFKRGVFYGILGPNGCGKSTFLDLLLGYLKPEKGEVILEQKNIKKYKKREIAKKIAYVPQNYAVNFPYTAEEIVLMGRYPYIPKFSLPTKKDYQLVEHIEKLMELDSLRHRIITNLSGGEKQRVMIARAIAQDTQLTLLDEPTSNLDIKHSLKILDIFRKKVKKENKTVICVFHNINEAAQFCDELIFMKKGNIIAAGCIEEVLNEDVLKEVFEIKCRIYFEKRLNCYHIIFYSVEGTHEDD